MTTIASLLRDLEGVDRPGPRFEDGTWTHAQVVAESAARAALLRDLRRGGTCADPVWWRPGRSGPYRPLTDEDAAAIRSRFEARGRLSALEV